MWMAPVAFAEWRGSPTLQFGVGAEIGPEGVFVMGRPDLVNRLFMEYFHAALSSVRLEERISIDINYCFEIPVEFCTSPQRGPLPTDRERKIFDDLQYMTVGYAEAYRSSKGWARKCSLSSTPSSGWCPVSQPDLVGTSLGTLLFDADYWLKTWIIGKDPYTGALISDDTHGMKSFKEYLEDMFVDTGGKPFRIAGRFWFDVLDSDAYFMEDSKGVWFRPVQIVVCSAPASSDNMSLCAPPSDSATSRFVDALNEPNRLSELAETYPVLAQMEVAAHAIVAAKWIAENRPSWKYATPERTAAAATRVKMRLADSDRIIDLRFPGGVVMDPSVRTTIVPPTDDDGTFAAIADAVAQRPDGASNVDRCAADEHSPGDSDRWIGPLWTQVGQSRSRTGLHQSPSSWESFGPLLPSSSRRQLDSSGKSLTSKSTLASTL